MPTKITIRELLEFLNYLVEQDPRHLDQNIILPMKEQDDGFVTHMGTVAPDGDYTTDLVLS